MRRHLTFAVALLLATAWIGNARADVAPDPEDCTESWWENNGREDCEECPFETETDEACEEQYAGTDFDRVCIREEEGYDVGVWCLPGDGDDDDDDDGPICHMAAPSVTAPLTGGMVVLGLFCLALTRRRG